MLYYIDPGTGSMLFTILIGVISAGIYGMKNLIIKLRFVLSGGKATQRENDILPFVIFSDDKRYWNVFEPICNEFEKRGERIVYMTASADDPALERNYNSVECRFIGEGNKAFAKLNMLKADVLLSTTPGLDVYQWKRSKNVKWYVHILHAANDPIAYRMFGLDFYDAVLVSGEYQINQIRQLERLRNIPEKELPIIGLPHMDEIRNRLNELNNLDQNETTVLLAPSWGKSSIFSKYGSQIIDELIKTGYHIIIRPHPQSFISEKELIEPLMEAYPNNNQLEWNRDRDNFDVLNKSSLLISDFSGVIFDFTLVFDKPIVYADTEYDKSPYDACWIEDEMWTFTTLPKLGVALTKENITNLKDIIDDCITNERFRDNREQARVETWQNIGESAKLTVDYLIEKRNALLSKG